METTQDIPEEVYHALVRITNAEKNPNNVVEKIQIIGTYTSIHAAKDAAHNCLFDAGYEREWFEVYEVDPEALEAREHFNCKGLKVLAISPGGTTFRVCIDTTLNRSKLSGDMGNHRVSIPLYYVVSRSDLCLGVH